MKDNQKKRTKGLRSLTLKLALSFFVFSLVILLIISSIHFFLRYNEQKELFGTQQRLVGSYAAGIVKGFLQERASVLESASLMGNLADLDAPEQKTQLEKLLGSESSFNQIVLLDRKLAKLSSASRASDSLSTPITERIPKDIPFLDGSSDLYYSDVYIDETTSEPLLVIGVPVKDIFDERKGILMAEVNLRFMWDLVGNLDVGKNGLTYVVDKKGRLIAYSDVSRVLKGENLAHLLEVSEFMQSEKILPEHRVEVSTGILGEEVISIPVPLTQPNWAVIIETPIAEAFSPLVVRLQVTLVVILLSILLVVAGSAYLSRKITRPIKELSEAAGKISQGEMDVQIEIESNDEIGDLAFAFVQMSTAIRQYETKISKHAEEVEQHEKELEMQVAQRTKELETKVEELDISKKAILNILEDIEDSNKALMRAQSQLENSLAQLKRLDIQKDQFISIAAHELKTPLTSIKGFTDLLKKDSIVNNPELRQKYLSIIFRDTKRLSELISNILELSRMDIGTLKLQFQQIPIPDLFDEVKEQMGIIISQKGLESEFSVEKDLPQSI